MGCSPQGKKTIGCSKKHMKIVIAPSGAGKTHRFKGLTNSNPESRNPKGLGKPVTWHGHRATMWDGDTIPAISGVYKAMGRFKRNGRPWWTNPNHGPVKAQLMRRAFGQMALDTTYREGIVLTAESVPLFMMPSSVVMVVPCPAELVANANSRHTGQPTYTIEEAELVYFAYKSNGAMAGVQVFDSFVDAFAHLNVVEDADVVSVSGEVVV